MKFFKQQTTTLRDGCVINSILVVSPALKNAYENIGHIPEVKAKLSAGISSGLIAHLLSQPFNAIKTEAQELTTANPALIAKKLYNQRGLLGFYSNSLGRGSRLIAGMTLLSYISPVVITTLEQLDSTVCELFDKTNNQRTRIQNESENGCAFSRQSKR